MYSKETENYKLPQWIEGNHPDFLTDMNEAMRIIDKSMFDNKGDYSSLKEQVEAISTNMVTINEEFKQIKETVDQLENLEDNPTFKALEEQVNQLNTDYTDLQQAVATNTGDITVLKSKMSTAESSIATINNTLTALKATVEGHTVSIEGLQNALMQANNNIQELSTDVGNLKVSQSQQDTKITNLETWRTEAEEKIENLQSGAEASDTQVGELAKQITNLQTTSQDHSTRLSTVENDVTNVEEEVSKLKTFTTEEAAKLTALTTQVASIDDEYNRRVGAVEASDIKQNAELASLDSRMESVEDSIGMVGDSKGVYKYVKVGFGTGADNISVKESAIIALMNNGDVFIKCSSEGGLGSTSGIKTGNLDSTFILKDFIPQEDIRFCTKEEYDMIDLFWPNADGPVWSVSHVYDNDTGKNIEIYSTSNFNRTTGVSYLYFHSTALEGNKYLFGYGIRSLCWKLKSTTKENDNIIREITDTTASELLEREV